MLRRSLPLLLVALACLAQDRPAVTLTGSGATFPYPIYAKWFEAFHRGAPSIEVRYEPIGSEAGLKRLEQGSVDFAASDIPPDRKQTLAFATIMGAAVPIYNVEGPIRELRFTPDVLAGIYLGTIKNWNDPAIQASNRGTPLPNKAIAVIHRSDGSGTSYLWTDYLSKVSPRWKSTVGTSGSPQWPVGTGAPGNEGVADQVRQTANSIGYVEYFYAIKSHLSYGSVKNKSGLYIRPDLENIATEYPIATFSWLLLPREIADPSRKKALKQLLTWILGPGQKQAAALGYVALPEDLCRRQLESLSRF